MADSVKKALILALTACALATPALAQAQQGGADIEHGNNGSQDDLEQRLRRQHLRVNHALKAGFINDEQAKKLRDAIDDVASDMQDLKQKNGGTLKQEDFKQIQNSLNQTSEQIRSLAEAGHATVQSGKVLGPTWTKGPDGAQNPKKLLQQMKQENKRELRQERQANEQKLEQQQLEYEREMVENLSEQKQNIIKQKDDLKDVRKESGAD